MTTLIRQPIPPATPAPAARRPIRRNRLGLLVVIVLLGMALVAAGLVALIGMQRRTNSATEPFSAPPSAAATPAAPVQLSIAAADDFDPQGDPPEENPGEAKLAVDGNMSTRWRTNRYLGNPKLGNLKRGVGLVVDLGKVATVGSVKVSLSGSGTNVDVRVPKGDAASVSTPPMTSDSHWTVVGKATKATKTTEIDLAGPIKTRYLLVYLTSLPREGGGYRGGVYEIEAFS